MSDRPNGAAAEGAVFDLDAARQARREKQGPAPAIVVAGKRYELPRSLPLELLDVADWTGPDSEIRMGPKDLDPFMAGLVGEETWSEIRATGKLELDDLFDLLPGILGLYGLSLGESSASEASSPDTGTPSRPTSPASTVSTSPKPSTARRRRSPSGASAS